MAYRRTERVLKRLAARHDAIVAAARDLAAEAGLGAVQIVPVARRAGIAVGTVYRYFPAKADLVAALVAALRAQELAAIDRAADAAPGPLSALAAAILCGAARAQRQRRLAWAVLAEPVDPEFEQARAAYRTALAGQLARRIAAALAAGHLPEQDAAASAAAVLGALVEGVIGPLTPEPEAADRKIAVQAFALLVLRGLGVVDARARGVIMQAAWPPDDGPGS